MVLLIRNTMELGVPFGPFPIRVLGLKLGELLPEQRWNLDPAGEHWGLTSELNQLVTLFGLGDPHRPTFGAASVLLLASLPFALVLLLRRKRIVAVVLGLLVASQLATYWNPSFALLRNHYAFCNARFFMLVPTIAVLLAPTVLRSRKSVLALGIYLVLASALSIGRYLSFFPSSVEMLPLLAFAGMGLVLAFSLPIVTARMHVRVLGTSAIALGALALVFLTPPLEQGRAAIRYDALMHSMVGHRIPVEWTEFARLTDDPRTPQRVAIVSGPLKVGARQLIYYFLGSKLQNQLVYFSPLRDGRMPVFDRQRPSQAGADADAWVRRLVASGTQYVALLSPPWIETRWITERKDTFELVAGNYASLLFRVRRPTVARSTQ
jgi:hypothetical protein